MNDTPLINESYLQAFSHTTLDGERVAKKSYYPVTAVVRFIRGCHRGKVRVVTFLDHNENEITLARAALPGSRLSKFKTPIERRDRSDFDRWSSCTTCTLVAGTKTPERGPEGGVTMRVSPPSSSFHIAYATSADATGLPTAKAD